MKPSWEKLRQIRLEATKDMRAKNAEKCKERSTILKANGICICCGHNEAVPERVYCPQCQEKKRQGTQKWRLENPDKCERQKIRAKALREKRVAEGICVYCGKEKALPGLQSCHDCRLYKNQYKYGVVEHTDAYYKRERLAGRL